MQRRVLFGGISCCFIAGLLSVGACCAYGQTNSAAEPRAGASASALTVSAASLRVSSRARDHYVKAVAANLAHREQEFNTELSKALESAPQFAEAYLLRAAHAVNEQRYDAALADAFTAQRLDAGLLWMPLVLAQAYNGLRRYDEALPYLESLGGAARTSWQAKYERARAEIGLRHTDAALYWSAQTLAAKPSECPVAHVLYANALELSGRWREASDQLEMYMASPDPEPYRVQVLAALAITERMAQQEALPKLAARSTIVH